MSDEESQRQIPREKMVPENALSLVVKYERGLERQIKMSRLTIHTKSGSTTNFLTRTRAAKTRNFNNMSIDNHKLNPTWKNVVKFGTTNTEKCARSKEGTFSIVDYKIILQK